MSIVRRGHPRLRTVLAVTARGPHELMRGLTENLSRGGLFVVTRHALDPGTEMDLSLVFPEIGQVLDVVAVVRWVRLESASQPAGMGLEFTELPTGGDAVIDQFLSQSAPL